MYKLDFLRKESAEKKSKYQELEKIIYTHPLELDTSIISSKEQETRFSRVNDERIDLDLSYISWIEASLIVFLFLVLGYMSIYRPIYEYNMIINVPREIVETGYSSYSKEIQEKYAQEPSLRTYRNSGLNRYRKIAFRDSNLFLLVIFLPLAIGGICWFSSATRHCFDRLVFDRKQGMLYYRCNYGLRRRSCTFNEASFRVQLNSLVNSRDVFLAVRFPKTRGSMMLSPGMPFISLSLYVWFMDRNRPLPPGTAFDAYRETDYLRRKSEGFPEPLYPSGVPTPEDPNLVKKYNDTQAAERATRLYDKRLKSIAFSEDNIRDNNL